MEAEEEHKARHHNNNASWIIGIVVVVVLIIGAGAVVWFTHFRDPYKTASYTGNSSSSSGAPTLSFLQSANQAVPSFASLTVEANKKGVKVINGSSDDWTNCNIISVNDYYLGDATATGPTISASSSVTYPYISFSRAGTSLNPTTTTPTTFSLECNVNGTVNSSDYSLPSL